MIQNLQPLIAKSLGLIMVWLLPGSLVLVLQLEHFEQVFYASTELATTSNFPFLLKEMFNLCNQNVVATIGFVC